MADNSKAVKVERPEAKSRAQRSKEAMEAHLAFIENRDNWEWVEVPETDLFDKPFDGVSINFEQFGPGRHFVDPEKAGEIRRLLKARIQADLRVFRPTTDKKMVEIMARNGKPITTATVGTELPSKAGEEYLGR